MFGQFSLNHQYWVWFHCKARSRASPTVTKFFFYFFFHDQVSKFQRKCSEPPPPPLSKTFDSSAGTECIVLCCWVSGCGDFVRFRHRLLSLLIFLFIPCYWWSLIIKSPQINTAWLIPTGKEPQLFSFFFFNGKGIWLFLLGTSRTSQPWCLSNKCTIPTKCDALGRGKRTSVPIIPDSALIILWQQRYDDWPHTSFQIYSFSYY